MAGSKHISFEDPERADAGDGHTSASDEDGRAVEVSFDPDKLHRRKSSLVTSDLEIPKQLRNAAPNKASCIVHQFFESQRRIHEANNLDVVDEGSSLNSEGSSVERADHHPDLDRLVEPKGSRHTRKSSTSSNGKGKSKSRKARCTVLGAEAGSDSEAGQVDELAWRKEITKSMSEMDLAAAGEAAALSRTGTGSEEKGETPGGVAEHSRLLTKKQLSEMAWGVRQLSRRLGNLRMKFRVKSVFLLTKIHDEDLIAKTRELARWLLSRERGVQYTVYVEKNLKENKKFDAEGLLKEVEREYAEAEDADADGEETKEVVGSVGSGTSDTSNGHSKGAPERLTRRLRYWDEDMARARPHTFDFVITLGGDGTVLYASWLFQRIVPPVLSFSLGSLGFLTKFEFDEYKQTMATAFDKGVTVSLRLRFEGTVMRSVKGRRRRASRLLEMRRESGDGDESEKAEGSEDSGTVTQTPLTEEEEEALERKRDLVEELIGEEKDDEHTHRPDGTFNVLNEIVVDRGPNPTLSTTEIFGDEEHFTTVLADGICVSTPTGSTAYNLAAGGSLCHPENPVMLVSAICAHTLSFRPIVLPDTVVLRIGVPYDARTGSWASFDGRERTELRPGDYVTVSASRYPFASVQAQGRRSEDWVNSISGKLGWNTRQRQKAYKEWEK